MFSHVPSVEAIHGVTLGTFAIADSILYRLLFLNDKHGLHTECLRMLRVEDIVHMISGI